RLWARLTSPAGPNGLLPGPCSRSMISLIDMSGLRLAGGRGKSDSDTSFAEGSWKSIVSLGSSRFMYLSGKVLWEGKQKGRKASSYSVWAVLGSAMVSLHELHGAVDVRGDLTGAEAAGFADGALVVGVKKLPRRNWAWGVSWIEER